MNGGTDMKHQRLATVLGFMVLITACTAVPGAKPASSVPTASATPAAAQCYQLTVSAGQGPETIGELRQSTTDTAIGVFRGYGEPRWNTPDGQRPSPEEVQVKSASIVRAITLEVKGTVRGAREDAEHAIARGGTIGCDTFSYPDDTELVEGQRYMFFMIPVSDSEGQPSGEFLVTNAWPIGNDDVVTTARDGDLPLPAAIDAVKNGPKVTAPPSPGEPPETTTGP